jgi:hypothetical protein
LRVSVFMTKRVTSKQVNERMDLHSWSEWMSERVYKRGNENTNELANEYFHDQASNKQASEWADGLHSWSD